MMDFNDIAPWQPLLIAETACGHDGKLSQLIQLIDCVAGSGASVIKFQVFKTHERSLQGHPEWEIFSHLELSSDQWNEAVAYSHSKNLAVLADVFGRESFELACSLGVDGFKVHSEDLLNSYFIAKVAACKKLVLIGVGAARRVALYKLMNFLKAKSLLNNVVLVTGVQTFPTPVEAHSLMEVSDLIAKYSAYGIKVGFSDHVAGDLPQAKVLPLLALSAGAVVIEKHVTLERSMKWTDYQSALSGKDFKEFVGMLKEMSPLLAPIGELNQWEEKYRYMFKKTPCAAHDLSAGRVLTPEDIVYCKNPQKAVPLASLDLVGQRLDSSLKQGEGLRLNNCASKVGIVIVARCASKRLPNKAVRTIQGRESIAVLIDRMKRCKKADGVVLATSTDPSDDVLVDIAKREGILSFRGSLDNVAQRFYEAAKCYGFNQIVRVTGDALLCDEKMLDRIIEQQLYESNDVTFMDNMPYGTAKEIFSIQTIEAILNTVYVPSNTEYLEWFLENNRYFNVGRVSSGYTFDPRLRITLDYEEDLMFFDRIYGHFQEQGKHDFSLEDALQWLAKYPEVAQINMHKMPKYTSKDLDVRLRI